MNRYAVAGIDPGNTTGCFGAQIYIPGDGHHLWSLTTHLELKHAIDVREWLDNFIHRVETPNLVVGIERFVITPRTSKLSRQPAALGIIGIMEELCQERRVSYRLQMKSEVVKLGSDVKLRKLGWYSPGQGHANDAARHALFALAHQNEAIFAALIEPIV
jgi:hypothetical protein